MFVSKSASARTKDRKLGGLEHQAFCSLASLEAKVSAGPAPPGALRDRQFHAAPWLQVAVGFRGWQVDPSESRL